MTSRSVSRRLGCTVVGVAACCVIDCVSAPSFAQDAVPEAPSPVPEVKKDEWPCVYRKVPVLSAATIWDGPANYRHDELAQRRAIRKLSEYLVSRRVKEDDAEAAIKKYRRISCRPRAMPN